MNKDLVGFKGESIARKFIRSRDYSQVEQNYKTPFGEIDIIAQKEGRVVFFEVKTRVSERFGPPSAAITREKRKHVIKNCMFYLNEKKLFNGPVRIDVIAIILDEKLELLILKHVRNAIQVEG